MKALNQRNIAECSKKLCQNPEIMDSAVFSCQRFSSLHGFKAVFLEDWAEHFSRRCFCSPWCALSQQQHHFLCESGWREVMCCDVFTGVGLCKKTCALPCPQSKWFSFKFAQEFIIQLSPHARFCFMCLRWCTFPTSPSKF